MANNNYALVVNDLHGVAEREEAFFQAVQTYRDHVDHIILNGDVFGGQHVGRLQKLFYDVKNQLRGDFFQENLIKAVEANKILRIELADLIGEAGEFNFFDNLSDSDAALAVGRCLHYGVFLSLVCECNSALRTFFEQDILDGICDFFDRLQAAKPENCVVILNTGNWEEATPIDYDPSDVTVENRVPFDQRLSRKIEQVCADFGVVFNEGYLRINRTGIVGAKAIIDAGTNSIVLGVHDDHVDQMIAHFPSEYERFPEHNPSEKDKLCALDVTCWLRDLHARGLYHGHIHSQECRESYCWCGVRGVHTRKVGLMGYALVQL